MLWIRDWYHQIRPSDLVGRVIVHGHVPIPFPQIQAGLTAMTTNLYLNIDNGVYLQGEGMGSLIAVDLTNGKLIRSSGREVKIKSSS